ncbi:hypothetical protein ACIA5A_15275 [Micromonospora sp. NPDC051300]
MADLHEETDRFYGETDFAAVEDPVAEIQPECSTRALACGHAGQK